MARVERAKTKGGVTTRRLLLEASSFILEFFGGAGLRVRNEKGKGKGACPRLSDRELNAFFCPRRDKLQGVVAVAGRGRVGHVGRASASHGASVRSASMRIGTAIGMVEVRRKQL